MSVLQIFQCFKTTKMGDYTAINLPHSCLRNALRQIGFVIEGFFHFSTSSFKVKDTGCNFYIGRRLFVREVCKYVLHAQCIDIGKRKSGHENE